MPRLKNTSKINSLSSPSRILVINIIALVLIGILMVYESSIIYAITNFGNKYHFLLLQAGWMIIGITGMFIISKIDGEILRRFSLYIWIFSIVSLILVLIPTPFAPEVYGARRWLVLNPEGLLPAIPILGRVNFQPGEFAKVASILFFSSLVTSERYLKDEPFKKFLKYFALCVFNVGLIALEPNFSTSFVLAIIITAIYVFSDSSLKYLFYTAPLGILAIGTFLFSSEYRRLRIMTLFSPEQSDKLSTGYHINQIMIALGSGGLFGLGLGRSRQKFDYLPEVTADSIFAIIGEEMGFIGAIFVVSLLVFLIWQCFSIATKSENRYLGMVSAGVAIWLMVQTFINLGAMVRLLPITGIPLPLLSYGGSSAIFILLGLGLVLNASRYIKIDTK